MAKRITITDDNVHLLKSDAGGMTRAVFRALGDIPWKHGESWRDKLIGRTVTAKQFEKARRVRNDIKKCNTKARRARKARRREARRKKRLAEWREKHGRAGHDSEASS